jgi:hypothetical protein
MWICLNNAFFSIVSPSDRLDVDNLVVRARRPGDIERIFPGYKAEILDGRDYQFRALIPRKLVGPAIATLITSITYTNFKNSVRDHDLHRAYADFWHVMARVQPQRPYSNYSLVKRPPMQRPLAMAAAASTASRAVVQPPAVNYLAKLANLVETVRAYCDERKVAYEAPLDTPVGRVRAVGKLMGSGVRVSFLLDGAKIARSVLESKLRRVV